MVIIPNKTEEIQVKIPNNLTKSAGTKTLSLTNTVTKKSYTITFTDSSTSNLYYSFSHIFSDLPFGEYNYTIDGNKGLLKVEKSMSKTIYDTNITFKSYES